MINKLDARHRIKRSNLTGVVPTVPASLTDFTDGTWLNTDIRPGEFFYNIPDMKLWIGTNSTPFELTGSFALPLANVLLNGNTSGASDIIMDTTQVIKSGNGGGQISLDDSGNPGEISLTTDNGGYGESYLYMYPLGTELKSNTYGIGIDSTKTTMTGNTIAFESGTPSAGIGSLSAGAYKINISGDYILSTMCNTTNSNTIVIKNSASTFSSDNNDMNSSIISSRNSTITAGSYNSIILGGRNNIISAGVFNLLTGTYNTNTSGDCNIIGGSTNTTSGLGWCIMGGTSNVNSGQSSILCGNFNTNSGNSNFISGGGHTLSGSSSAIIGGSNITGTLNDTVYVPSLRLEGTTSSLVLSRLTTTERNALTAVNGMLIYNTTLNKFQGYENGAWVNLI